MRLWASKRPRETHLYVIKRKYSRRLDTLSCCLSLGSSRLTALKRKKVEHGSLCCCGTIPPSCCVDDYLSLLIPLNRAGDIRSLFLVFSNDSINCTSLRISS
ncbi:unnamed protein product [Albugo candida]|uniref:Uncharacterized protein n=1 Tax=Albugo candida TaxID=65357 RepID=A0A024FWP4_9STRA|nr:unnamed protein product [Albugo candida]|eukprot:CCI11451.1 unnamed protein product [Albugo candida]